MAGLSNAVFRTVFRGTVFGVQPWSVSLWLVGFVGLVVPHLARLAVGPDPRAVLPLSAIGGALLLLLADTIARSIGVPVGVVTALIGAPFLLWLLHRARTGYAL